MKSVNLHVVKPVPLRAEPAIVIFILDNHTQGKIFWSPCNITREVATREIECWAHKYNLNLPTVDLGKLPFIEQELEPVPAW